ncbi:hypothetical protein BLS_005971 [Venturia inaequalis]|uniref:Mid2 domain-containing protein n=1 Tax=Venturia inaequalis TaxID=5025 RepID=A0A8H3UEK8_VENIN|nr:hypothetical protein BLS_005971 [Venturia inaequalis]KAE9972138.1 hypothetical protein EG327_009586 [Venturia inaequalis]
MRSFGPFAATTLLYQFFGTTAAQSVQNLLWKVPDGKSTDLSLTFTNGVTLPLSWNNWSSPSYIDASATLVDLWATSYDYNLNTYAEVLKGIFSCTGRLSSVEGSNPFLESIDLTVAGNFAWTIAIPDKYLSVSAKYVLRFKKPATIYNADTADLSSPGFLVLKATTSSSTTTSSSKTSTSTSSSISSASSTASQTASATSSAPVIPSSTPTVTSQSQTGLTTGAKIGLGVGVALAVLVICALIAFLLTRRRKQKKPVTPPVYVQEKRYNDAPVEVWAEPAELPGGRTSVYPSELHGS